jgi:hypothetical protein
MKNSATTIMVNVKHPAMLKMPRDASWPVLLLALCDEDDERDLFDMGLFCLFLG